MMVAQRLKRFRTGAAEAPARSPGTIGAGLLDTEAMATLQRLSLITPTVHHGTFAGEHRSRRHGSSPEFADYRRYSPGDDIRRVDWNLYARFDELFVRLSEVTTDLSVHMLIDSSASMNWTNDPDLPTKHRFAVRIAAALGYATLWHFDRIQVTPFGMGADRPLRAVQGRTRIPEMLGYLDRQATGGNASLASRMVSYGHRDPVAGLLIILSDLLGDDPDELGLAFRQLRGRGWHITLLHVLDPAERDPRALFPRQNQTGEPTTLVDLEHGGRIMMNPSTAALDHYRQQFTAWTDVMTDMCRRQGIGLIALETDQSVVEVVRSLFNDHRLLQ